MKEIIIINGAHGEGGGQILRTSLALAAILNQPIRIENIRANRKTPGLAAQHLTAVRAAAMVCDAVLTGAELGSTRLTFIPHSSPVAGLYEFDVAQAREGGSAGAATLVLQTVLLPLMLAHGPSTITIRGGTHVAWSPSFHYLRDVYLPTIKPLGICAKLKLLAWGWYPAGQGEITMEVTGQNSGAALSADKSDKSRTAVPIQWLHRGDLQQVTGTAAASSLPAHIAQRMSAHATRLLEKAGIPASIKPQRVRSVSPGAGIFLTAEYESSRAGFSAIGKIGKPSERVAEEAIESLLAFHQTEAALDTHLTDQLVLPLAVSGYAGKLSTEKLSKHTLTNIWAAEQFLGHIATVNYNNNAIQFHASR